MTPAEFLMKVMMDAETVVRSRKEVDLLEKQVEKTTDRLTKLETAQTSAMDAVARKTRADADEISRRIETATRQANELLKLGERRRQAETSEAPTGGTRGRLREIEQEILELREKGNRALADAKRIYDGTRSGDEQQLIRIQKQSGEKIATLRTERELLQIGQQQYAVSRDSEIIAKRVLTTKEQEAARTREIIASIKNKAAVQRQSDQEEAEWLKFRQRYMFDRPGGGGADTPVARLASGGRMFESVAGTAANSANRLRFQMFQVTSAFQDIAVVLQNGGTFDRALLGAANNFGVLASTAAPLIAVLGTLAVIAIPTIVNLLLQADKVTESYAEKTKRLADEQHRLRDANFSLVDSFRAIQKVRHETEMGLGTKAEREGKTGLDSAIGEIARERFKDRGLRGQAEEFFVNREMLRIQSEQTRRDRIQASGVDMVSRKFGKDFFEKVQYAAQGGNMSVPFEQGTRMFGISGDVQKLLEVAGKAGGRTNLYDPLRGVWGGRFSDEVTRNMGITGGSADTMGVGGNRTMFGRSYQMTPEAEANFRRMAAEAVEAASRDATKLDVLGKVSPELRKAAEALAELRKKSSAEIAADTEKARAEGLAKAKSVMHGEDIPGLRSFMDTREFAGVVGAAEKREEIRDHTKRLDIERKRAEDERSDAVKDRLSEMRERLAKMNERGPGPGSKRLSEEISTLEQQEQRRARDIQMEEKRRSVLKDLGDIEERTVNRRKAARAILGDVEAGEAESAKSDAVQEQQLVSQRSLEGLTERLVNLQDAAVKQLEALGTTMDQIKNVLDSGGPVQTGPRGLNRNP